ncbi:type VI secretion protein ImpB [Allorhizobium sp. BGMRC 0089]|uniref:Y-family DNA polymerase n=1 Tax=Allorhizobium sonneratiae TaxID=2934936 RepID=UPI0020342272|nr:type VI secretion protein ImpB [Allorhizobium sonneratiae]MCM2292905.1 type VI secretion protein ImpB [Allorhizobium sonneratiae]
MRKPETIERLYLDFDGFFASVEQQADPSLRGRPIGVVPFAGTDRTAVIACSREAKAMGVKNVMGIREARAVCPDLILVPQKPDLYRRAHNTLLAEIEAVLPIDAVKSIDELTCRLDEGQRRDPQVLAARLKERLARTIGPFITASIGMAANRQLAKIACKAGKKQGTTYGNGLAIWPPEIMPGPLLEIKLDDIPGVGRNLYHHLMKIGVYDTRDLLALQPKQMRKIWGNVTGERLWYALHGYDIQAPEAERGAFGHGRVLPPESRSLPKAYEIARLLMIKAARRLRRAGYYCSGVCLWLSIREGSWSRKLSLPVVHDDAAVLAGLATLWAEAERDLGAETVFRVGVTLVDLSYASQRQLDMLVDDDHTRRKWEQANAAIDTLNARYSRTTVSLGPWSPPAGGHVGGKISYTRIPSAEDFW